MKVPLEWLNELVPVKLAPKALADRLTLAGLEVVGQLEADGQPVFDLEVTPNRPDCLSMIGVAREVAAVTGQSLRLPLISAPAARPPKGLRKPTVRIDDRQGCPRYIGRLLAGVAIGPSPEWMQRRLLACGARPVNNAVDITNYVLFEYGQPLHAFDFARLAEGALIIRSAQPNERLVTLDGVGRTLAPGMLVIADARQPVAVAGVMGGTGSEVTARTTEVLLESAYFDPIRVRRTARQLGLASDSSYRFERGVDPLGVEAASRRAAQLFVALSGATEVAVVDAGAKPKPRPPILFMPKRAQEQLGIRMPGARVKRALVSLGCRVSAGAKGALRVAPPSFRADLKRDVDLNEELARLIGYDRIPATLPAVPIAQRRIAPTEAYAGYAREHALRSLCASLGLDEVITWSLISEHDLAGFGARADHAAKLVNPLSQDHAYLRPSLLPGMLQVVRRNLTQGAVGIRMFELGNCVLHGSERLHLGLAVAGVWSRDWRGTDAADFYRIKGLARTIISRLNRAAVRVVPADAPWAEPGQAAHIIWNEEPIGVAGQLAARIAKRADVEQPIWLAELHIAPLLTVPRTMREVHAPATMPPVKRDLSFTIAREVGFEAIDRTIRQVAGAAASRIDLVDRYTGAPVPPEKVSLTFSIEYRNASRTLTAGEVDAVHQRISQTLAGQFGAQLR